MDELWDLLCSDRTEREIAAETGLPLGETRRRIGALLEFVVLGTEPQWLSSSAGKSGGD